MNVMKVMVVVVTIVSTLKEALNVLVVMVTCWIAMELVVQVLLFCLTNNKST